MKIISFNCCSVQYQFINKTFISWNTFFWGAKKCNLFQFPIRRAPHVVKIIAWQLKLRNNYMHIHMCFNSVFSFYIQFICDLMNSMIQGSPRELGYMYQLKCKSTARRCRTLAGCRLGTAVSPSFHCRSTWVTNEDIRQAKLAGGIWKSEMKQIVIKAKPNRLGLSARVLRSDKETTFAFRVAHDSCAIICQIEQMDLSI